VFDNSWPRPVRDALRRHRRAATPGELSRKIIVGVPNHVAMAGSRISIGGECVFLLSRMSHDIQIERAADGAVTFNRPHRLFQLLAVVESGEHPPEVIFDDVALPLYARQMKFGAIVWHGRLALLTSDTQGIYLRFVDVVEGRLVMEPPVVIAESTGAGDLIAQQDEHGRIHLAWTDQTERGVQLRYMFLDEPDVRSPPRVISKTVRHGPTNLMIHDNHVSIAWVDTRFQSGTWETITHYKQFLTSSDDRGQTFATPITLNDPRDRDDTTNHSISVPGTGGVFFIESWSPVDGLLPVKWVGLDLQRATLIQQPIQGGALENVINSALTKHHHAVCSE
jgi:hypothetical protein